MDCKQLERRHEVASGDYRRLAYLLAEVRRKEPDHLVAIAMMSPAVEAARRTLDLAAIALREARNDRHKSTPQGLVAGTSRSFSRPHWGPRAPKE